jgi:hypothetical protein
MEDVLYIHQKNIQENSLECRPYEELGFDYEIHGNFEELGEYPRTDAGLVNIDKLINKLIEMKSNGATHVACDFHCDHVELDLYGVEYRLATPQEIEAFHNANKAKEERKKQLEIEQLEAKLKRLKGE